MQYIESASAAMIQVDGREILSFGGCSYLGMANVGEVLQAGQQAIARLGATAQLPQHYGFLSPANFEAEEAARSFFDVEDAMYLGSGYLFAMAALAGLKDDYDVAILDETAHFCLTDGAKAAGKEIATFKHCDAGDLERVAAEIAASGRRFVIATDGAFPTYGLVPPLGRYAEIVGKYDTWLIVDESHSFGAVGETGRGACEHEGILGRCKILSGGSTSKAFGAFGGLAIGSSDAIARLWTAPVARGAAAGMSSGAAMTAASLQYLRAHPECFEAIRKNSADMRARLAGVGIICAASPAPIFAFTCGSAEMMRAAQQALYDDGIYIIYSNYVGAGPDGALRIAVFADHTPDQFDRLIDGLVLHLPSLNRSFQ